MQWECNSYGFPGFRCFSFLINFPAFCKAHTWASLNGNVNRFIDQIEGATTIEQLTLIQSKLMVLVGGHNLLREENQTYVAPALPKSGRGGIAIAGGTWRGGIAIAGGTSGSGQAASSSYAAQAASSGEAARGSSQASSVEAAPVGASSQASSSVDAAPVGASSQASSLGEAAPSGISQAAGGIVAKPSSQPYFRMLQQTGKARAIAKSVRMPPQNKAAARPTIDCINDLQARRAKSKPPAVPPKAMPSQTLQKVQPKTPPKHRPKQPIEPPPKHLLVVYDSDDDWGDWRGDADSAVAPGSVDANMVVDAGNADASSVDADSVVAAGSADADSAVDTGNVMDAVATCRDWADEELNAGILQALQELAETKKASIIAKDNAASERPKWWKKRGTSSRGGSGTYLWPLYRR